MNTDYASRNTEPSAPRDPEKERPTVWLLFENLVEARPGEDGSFRDICYLEGRVEAKLKSILPELDEELARKLQLCSGFRELAGTIGVSVTASDPEKKEEEMRFSLNCGDAAAGVSWQGRVKCDGRELRIPVMAAAEGPGCRQETSAGAAETGGGTETGLEEGPLSSIVMAFPEYMTARVTVALYLREGISVPKKAAERPIGFDTPAYDRLLARSVLQKGDLSRIRTAAAKARRGEDVTIAFIGGSITQGAAAKPIGTESYAFRAYKSFAERFGRDGGKNVHFVKAGVGGTSSEFGVIRYERDVLRGGTVKPDILVIEFAVNDAGDETEGVPYESLVRKAWNDPGKPAVILLFAVFMDDWNLQERLSPVGLRYNLPMISIRDAVVPQFYEPVPVITKRQYFYDLYHPTNEGHRIMADCIGRLWDEAEREPGAGAGSAEEAKALSAEAFCGLSPAIGSWLESVSLITRDTAAACPAVSELSEGAFVDRDAELQCVELDDEPFATPEFTDNWMSGGGTEPLALTIRCRTLLLVYKDSGDARFGKAAVYVDGKAAREINPLEVGWTHCNAALLFHGQAAEEHRVEIRPEEGKRFTVLGFGYVW